MPWSNKELISKFEQTHSFETRKKESDRVMQKYEDRVVIIAEPLKGDKNMEKNANISKPKNKFLVSYDITVAQFQCILRKRLNIQPESAIYIYCKSNVLPPTTYSLGQLYNEHVSNDGFLYIFYGSESTFG